MRARNLKPGFFKNEELAELPPIARLLFQGLWCLADREGRVEDRPRRIKAEVLPYDDCDVDGLLDALAAKGFIRRYTVSGVNTLDIPKFKYHQNPHKNEKPSELPAYSDFAKLRDEYGTNRAESPFLNPDTATSVAARNADAFCAHPAEKKPRTKSTRSTDSPAQSLVAYYVDQARANGLKLTSTDKGRIGRYVKEVLEQGAEAYVVRAAIDRMVEKRLGPHLLGQLVNEVEPRARPSPEEHERLVREMLAKARGEA